MNPYNFAALFFAFGTFFLGLLVLLKRRDRVGVYFFVFSVFVTGWGIGYSILINGSASYESALFGARFCNTSALFVPVTWVNFILVFLGYEKQRKRLLYFLYAVAFSVLPFSFSGWFVPSVAKNLIPGFANYAQPGPVFHLFTLLFFLAVPYGFIQLVKAAKEATGENLVQLRAFIIATLFGYIGGSLTFAPVYGIKIPQYGVFLMPIYPFIMAYATIRHRLFDIEQVAQAFQREKLATIGLIASSVNHEIRNPLYAVKSLLES